MAKNIEPKLVPITEYLTLPRDTYFHIPEYQRAYSWGTDNCDKLWQDIVDFSDSDGQDSYFFGTIIVNCRGEDDTEYSLIDGQQRTTTFLLLFKALLIKLNAMLRSMSDTKESAELRRGFRKARSSIIEILYQVDPIKIEDEPDEESDRELYRQVSILKNQSINESYRNELETILKAADEAEAEQNVIKIKYKKGDNRYSNFFRNFRFFLTKLAPINESQLLCLTDTILKRCEVIRILSWKFEQAITMFNSLNSDGLPLYDSDIISARLYAEAQKQGEAEAFRNLWETLFRELKDYTGSTIDAILLQHMYTVRSETGEIRTGNDSVNITTPGLRRYYTEINKDLLKQPVALCNRLLNLVRIWKKTAAFPLAKLLFKFNTNSKLFLAGYFSRFTPEDISEDAVRTVFESMLRLFTILELVDAGYSSRNFKSFLFKESLKLVDKTVPPEVIEQDFIAHIRKTWLADREKIRSLIKEYEKHSIVFLNDYLFAKSHGMVYTLSDTYDVEHIMPDSGKNLQIIREDAGIADREEFDSIVNQVGNKIQLECKINRSIGNEWFRTKICSSLKDKTGYIDSVCPIAQALVDTYRGINKPYWTKDDIAAATEKAADRILAFIFGE